MANDLLDILTGPPHMQLPEAGYSVVRRIDHRTTKRIFSAATYIECEEFLRLIINSSDYEILPFSDNGRFGEGTYG